jgi:Flp pilus assembly protein TadG
MKNLARFARHCGGASAVEFALVAGPFLLLLFGVVEFSRAMWTRQALLDVTASAARCVAIKQLECTDTSGTYSASKTQNFMTTQAKNLGVALSNQIAVQENAACDGLDGFTVVTAHAQFNSVFPITDIVSFSSQSCFARQA